MRRPQSGKSGFTARGDSIEHYLQDMAKHTECWAYGFIVKHGRLFGPLRKLPKGCKRGQPQMCFWNSYVLTCLRPELIYVEGFVRVLFGKEHDRIIHHAWAVDRDRQVCDPTLSGCEYFGIPFKADYVKRTIKRILPTCFSLLDNDTCSLEKVRSTKSWLFTA